MQFGLSTDSSCWKCLKARPYVPRSLLSSTPKRSFATPNADGQALLIEIAERFSLTARGYHRVMRVARTMADLAGSEVVERAHIAEAASFWLPAVRGPSQPRISRKAAAAAHPEKMAMANENSP